MATSYVAAVGKAWSKIQEYCKEHYANISTRDVQVRWEHDVYGWTEFGVTPSGTPYINSGDHSRCSREKSTTWVFHPLYNNAHPYMVYPLIEKVVKDWPTVKNCLEKQLEKENRIFNFEP